MEMGWQQSLGFGSQATILYILYFYWQWAHSNWAFFLSRHAKECAVGLPSFHKEKVPLNSMELMVFLNRQAQAFTLNI